MKHLLFGSFLLIAFVLGPKAKGEKRNASHLKFSDFKVSIGEASFFSKSPLKIIESFNLHALPKTTAKIEFECNFIFKGMVYELKLELEKTNAGEWVMDEYEIDKEENTSGEIYFADIKMHDGPYSGFRKYYKSIVDKKYEEYLEYQTEKNKIRQTKERFLDLIEDESRDKTKDGYSELEVIAETLPLKDPGIGGVSRIEIEFEYLCEIKSRKGMMKVDFECLRQSENPDIWVINESDAYFKEFK